MNRFVLCFTLIFVLFAVPGCDEVPDLTRFETSRPDPANENDHKEWTIMMYGSLDIEEGLERALLRELEDMIKIGNAGGRIHLVSQIDLRGLAKVGGKQSAKRYYMKRKELIVKGDYGNVNMGDPEVFEDFLRWGLSYSADKYALIVMGHGTGWISLSGENAVTDDVVDFVKWYKGLFRGASPDARSASALASRTGLDSRSMGQASQQAALLDLADVIEAGEHTRRRSFAYDHTDDDCITLAEAEDVFNRVLQGRRLDIVAFRSCLMNGIEVLHSLSPFFDYVIVSETAQYGLPGHWILSLLGVKGGFDTHFLKELERGAAADPASLARDMTISLNNTNKKILEVNSDLNFQISCFDMSKIRAMNRSLRHLAGHLRDSTIDRDIMSDVLIQARDASTQFGGIFEGLYQVVPTDYEFIDLPEFMYHVDNGFQTLRPHVDNNGAYYIDRISREARTIRNALEQATVISFDNLMVPGTLMQTNRAATHVYFPSRTPMFQLMWKEAMRSHYRELSFSRASHFPDIIDMAHGMPPTSGY